jgi:hypothetical protein
MSCGLVLSLKSEQYVEKPGMGNEGRTLIWDWKYPFFRG